MMYSMFAYNNLLSHNWNIFPEDQSIIYQIKILTGLLAIQMQITDRFLTIMSHSYTRRTAVAYSSPEINVIQNLLRDCAL